MRDGRRECSHGETRTELAVDFPFFRLKGLRFSAFARTAGALIIAAPAKFVCAPSQVRQCKHHHQVAGVLGPTPEMRLAMPKLALDHPKRLLELGPDNGLEFLMTKLHPITYDYLHQKPSGLTRQGNQI